MQHSEKENKVVIRRHLSARICTAMLLGGLLLPVAAPLASNTAFASASHSQGAKSANVSSWRGDDGDGFDGFDGGGFGGRRECPDRRGFDDFDRFDRFDRFNRDDDRDDGGRRDRNRFDDRRFDNRRDDECQVVNVFVNVRNKQDVKVKRDNGN